MGDITALSQGMQKSIINCMERTKNNTGVIFNIALNYGGRDEIVKAVKNIVNQVKEIDPEDLKAEFDKKVAEIKEELEDLDKEKVLKIAKKKGNEIKKKADELVDLAVAKGTPVLKKAAEDVRDKAVEVTKDVQKKLEAIEI